MNNAQSFNGAMSRAGIEPPANIISDSEIHRFHVNGDKPNSLNGWYILHDSTPAAGAFGDWKRGITETWCPKEYRSLTTEEKARLKASQELIRKQRDAEQALVYADCRKASKEIWNKAKEVDPSHAYIIKKGIKPKGVRQLDNLLLIPVKDYAGALHGLQIIGVDGTKKFKTGTLKAGNFLILSGKTDKPILICEGYATGASLHEATSQSVVVAFDAGNLLPVAKVLREKLPDRQFIICADSDQWTAGNPGLTKATAAAKEIGALLAIPVFKDSTNNPTDFNDLHLLERLDAVRVCIEAAAETEKLQPTLAERITGAKPEDAKDIVSELTGVKSETERAVLIDALAKRLHIGKRAIQKDIQRNKPDAGGDQGTVVSANIPGLVDLCTDSKGAVIYLIKNEDALEVMPTYETEGVLYSPPEKQYLPFELSKAEEVIRLYEAGHDKSLFEDVISCLKRFSYLPDNQWLIVACKVFLSYLQEHPDIHYMPMILFYAVPERGKSRTGKAVSYLSYRGVHVVDLREANLFRFAQNLKATLFFDLMDLWKKAEKNGAEDILLLRYEKGAKATRVIYPEKGAFKDTVYYDVYGPTIIATNEPLHKILDSRGINITMPNKPGNYENPTPEKASDIKARLTAWRARIMDAPLPEIEPIEGITGRLWDISRPMFQVCKMVYPEGFNDLVTALQEVAGQKREDKKASIEGQIVTILYELSPEGLPDWTIKTADLLSKLNANRPEDKKLTSQYLGRKLKAIGLQTKIIMGYSQIYLQIENFNILLTQHGLENIFLPATAETLLNSTKLKEQPPEPVYVSRELKESVELSKETLLSQSSHQSQFKSLVESSRELTGISGKIFKVSSLELVS